VEDEPTVRPHPHLQRGDVPNGSLLTLEELAFGSVFDVK
jgi:hypothetical protein